MSQFVPPRAKSVVLIERHLTGLADGMNVEMIMTAASDLVVLPRESSVAEALALMGSLYDQLPIIEGGNILGVVTRDDLRNVAAGDLAIASLRFPASLDSLRSTDGFRAAISRLERQPFTLVFDPVTGQFCGLLHFSDLNRQAVRIFCYLWLSALEMALAEHVAQNCPTFDDWISQLDEHRQVTALGRYEFERRQNLEIGPVEGIELSDLTRLCQRIPILLNAFGLSKSQFEKKVGGLIHLRNMVMHPVRRVIRSHEQVAVLGRRLDDLRNFVALTLRVINSAN